ncbi:MAG: DinB family protein [Dehalococcoidia bacterium]
MAAGPNPYLYVLDEPLTRAQVLAELAAMPSRLAEVVDGATAEVMIRRPTPDEWSAFETFQHVRDATLTYAARFRWIVFNDNPPLPDYDENNWVATSRDMPSDIPEILDQVAASRADLIRVLSRLDDAQWMREGRHEIAGGICLEHYARHQVAHERMHLEQIGVALG